MTQVSQNEVKNDDVMAGTVVVSETSNACPSTPYCPPLTIAQNPTQTIQPQTDDSHFVLFDLTMQSGRCLLKMLGVTTR